MEQELLVTGRISGDGLARTISGSSFSRKTSTTRLSAVGWYVAFSSISNNKWRANLLQDWGFVCALIEVSVELFTIGVYAYAFWRIATKRKLRKSMDIRDRARSDLWLAKLREQEATNSDDEDETKKNTLYNMSKDPYSAAEEGMAPTSERPMQTPTSGGFQLQAVPKIRHHQPPVSLSPSPQVVQSGWGVPQPQLNSYDPTAIPLPPTPAFAPNQYRQSYVVPPTPASVRFNINPSPPPSRE